MNTIRQGARQSYFEINIHNELGKTVKPYESPKITRVGTVADLTRGNIFQSGQDSISWIRVGGQVPGWPGGGNGGGFGS